MSRFSSLCAILLVVNGVGFAATFQVTTTNDGGPGSLRQALNDAAANGTADVIEFSRTLSDAIELSTALPAISGALTLAGPGASQLSIQRRTDPNTPRFRIFSVLRDAEVTIENLSLRNGLESEGGAILNLGRLELIRVTLSSNMADGAFASGGGGILNSGMVRVAFCTISSNYSANGGGGIRNSSESSAEVQDSWIDNNRAVSGGGIANYGGRVVLQRSTVSHNRVTAGGGGILNYFGTTSATNSTFSGNWVQSSSGGGGALVSFGDVFFAFCTFTLNAATNGGSGGGIRNEVSANTTIAHSVIAGNFANRGPDLFGRFRSEGYNLFKVTAATLVGATNDLHHAAPGLFPLANYGGPAPTHLLRPQSPAVDAGGTNASVMVDQRGAPRRLSALDIGAIELRGLDTDQDSMADDFELGYGLDPSDPSDATKDSDSDGVSNSEEARAGTDPRHPDGPAAPLTVEVTNAEPGIIRLRFSAVAGVNYRLQASDSLDNADWRTLRQIPATDQVAETREPAVGRMRFFRVAVNE